MCIFAKRLNEAIQKSQLSRKEICKRSGIAKSSLSEYLSDKSKPKIDTLEALSEVLDVSSAWLIGHVAPKDFDKLNEAGKNKVDDYISDIMWKYKK